MMYFAREIILDTGNRLCNHHTIFVWYGNVTWVYASSDCQLCFIPCLHQAKEPMSITQDADSPADCGTYLEYHVQAYYQTENITRKWTDLRFYLKRDKNMLVLHI